MVTDPTPSGLIYAAITTPPTTLALKTHKAADAAGMTRILAKGEVMTLNLVGLFASWVAVRTVVKDTFRACNELVNAMMMVDTHQIYNAIKLIYNDT